MKIHFVVPLLAIDILQKVSCENCHATKNRCKEILVI
jgi:hypothetical protein